MRSTPSTRAFLIIQGLVFTFLNGCSSKPVEDPKVVAAKQEQASKVEALYKSKMEEKKK